MAGWRLEITLPKETYEKIQNIARIKTVSKSILITEILNEYCKTYDAETSDNKNKA